MISEISKRISLFLCRKNIIKHEDIEIYKYGFETICSTILGLILTLAIGLTFKMFFLSIVYYVVFVTIRQFTGGYHANSYFRCNLTFAVVTVLVFGLTKMAVYSETYTMPNHILFLFLSFIIVFYFSPIENEYKPLDQKQKKRNKKIAVVLTLAVSLLSCVVYVFSVQTSALLAFTQLAIAVLIVITKIEIGGEKDAED